MVLRAIAIDQLSFAPQRVFQRLDCMREQDWDVYVVLIFSIGYPVLDCDMNDLDRQIEEQRAKLEADRANRKPKPSHIGHQGRKRGWRKLRELEDLRDAQIKAEADRKRNIIILVVAAFILLYFFS